MVKPPQQPSAATGASRRRRRQRKYKIMATLAALGALAGIYLLVLLQSPNVGNNNAHQAADDGPKDNRVIIPSADINAPYFAGGAEILEQGAWHRYPDRGDPEAGGNFIITGHRFKFAASPRRTKRASTFYNIDKVMEGDEVIVHWQQQSYKYRVIKKHIVSPDAIQIEDPSEAAKLTLYTCTLGGKYDGREVIEAVPQ